MVLKKYVMSKIKIFNNQTKNNIALLNDPNLKKIYRRNKFSEIDIIKNNPKIQRYSK